MEASRRRDRFSGARPYTRLDTYTDAWYNASVPDTPSVIIVKRFPFRGKPEEWANRYHFSGTTPADGTAWKALYDAIIAAERPMFTAEMEFVRGYGYRAGVDHIDNVTDYTVAPNTITTGNLTATGTLPLTGDTAFWVRWQTPDFNSRGRRIYLRKYFHGARSASPGGDDLPNNQKSAALTYGAKMIDGTLPGGVRVCGPQGAVASTPSVSPYFTTRTLKRRGKRPPR